MRPMLLIKNELQELVLSSTFIFLIKFPVFPGQYREDGNESSAVIHTISTAIESFELSLVQIILGVKDSKKRQDKQGITQSQGACPREDQDERQPTCMTEELLTDGFTDSTSASFKRDHGINIRCLHVRGTERVRK